MFKKTFAVKPLAPLRSSDRRKLADQIIEDYGINRTADTVDTEQTADEKAEAVAARTSLRNSILPENVQSARFTTTVGPDLRQASGTLYVGSQEGEDARILWFQIDGKTFPSIYTAWRNVDIVPLLHTPDIVVKKIQGGADLMTPGLAAGPPFPSRATKGAVVAIASTDRPSVPMAIGVCGIDVSALQKVQGAKGHAVESMHWVGDELWSFSTSGKSGQQPPEELPKWSQILATSELANHTESLDLHDANEDGGVTLQHKTSAAAHEVDLAEIAKSSTTAAEDTSKPEDHKELTQSEIDDAFRQAFLYGVCHHKASYPAQKNFGIAFPINQSALMSTLVQPFLPAFTPEQSQQLQIKKTSWKNIKKFVKSLDKERIVKSKDQDGNQTVIWDIDFEDQAVLNFKPYRLPKKEVSDTARGDGASKSNYEGDDSIGQKLRVITLYKPTAKQQSLFTTPAGSKSSYSRSEVQEYISSYVDSEQLVSASNKRIIKLNPTLANSVFDGSGSLDKEVLAKGSVPRDALVDRVLNGMATSYVILRNDADATSVKAKSGTPPKVTITLETRTGHKTVTKVSGLEAYHVNPRPLADELRKTCAGSTSVEPLAGAAKKNEKQVMEVMIQGPQKDAVLKALERRAVEKRWVEVVDKTKGKK
jgi:translation initiation factor 2D